MLRLVLLKLFPGFITGKTELVLSDCSTSSGLNDVKIDGFVLKILLKCLSLLHWMGVFILYLFEKLHYSFYEVSFC